MWKLFSWLFLFSLTITGLEVTLNTQLDQKLEELKSNQKSNKYQYNILRKIEFVGLDKVDQQRIKNEISVVRGDVLDPYVINRNLKRIESLGFFSNVSSKQESYEGGVKWIITLVENPVLQHIKFIGNESINAEDLTSNLTSKVDELFNYNKTREDISKIEAKYKDEGFILSKVNKVDLPTLSNPTLTFFIQESEINAISVTGNTKTKDYVILRELDLEKGQKINEIELRKNLGRVYNLNYFSEVIPDLQPSISTKNVYDLIISVEEKSTDSVNFGGGWGQRSGGFLYSDLNINNFLGTGQLIALRGQWGNDLQTYQFKYHNPWMFGKRKSFTYRAWNTRGNFGFNNTMSTGYRPETRYGMDAAVGLPHSYELRSNHKVKIEDVYISNSSVSNEENYSIQSYAYSMSYDTRDVSFNPLNGRYYLATIENGFKLKANSLLFTKYDVQLSHFFQTFEKQTIATRLILGRINGNIEETEYYYIGGPNTVRGYVEYPNSFGFGKSQLLANIEYRFLISDMFQFLFFVDAGWASNLGDDITAGKIGKGFGIRINSPLGPIRIDLGIDELGERRTHLNIGHVF